MQISFQEFDGANAEECKQKMAQVQWAGRQLLSIETVGPGLVRVWFYEFF